MDLNAFRFMFVKRTKSTTCWKSEPSQYRTLLG